MGDAALAAMGRRRRVAMTVPVFAGVAAAVAASDMIGLMPEQLARRVAPRLGLGVWAAPMALPVATMCMAWHRRASATPAHRWLRDTVAGVLAPLDPDMAPP